MLQTMLLAMSVAVAAQDAAKPAPVSAASVKLPAQIQAQPGQIFAVVAEGNLKWCRWTIPAGLTRVPPELTACGDKGFVGYGPAGVYEFKCEGTRDDQFAEAKCVVFVGQPAPGPAPPGPRPSPDHPTDPLFAELQKLYTLDSTPGKAAHVSTLAGLFRTAGQAALKDDSVKTTGQLCAKLKNASALLLPADAILPIREKLGRDCLSALGKVDAPLTNESRDAAKLLFDRIAGLLENLR